MIQQELPSNAKKLKAVIISESILGIGCLGGLYGLWYADYPQSSFHFINDNDEWLGMDKAGHMMTSYYMGKVGYENLKWAGAKEKNAIWYGGLTGLAYLTTVEVFDGFSKEWGASPGDMLANSLGSALFISQQMFWSEQKIILKWSFQLTDYAQYNKAQLGSGTAQRMLKDYNGQTYWLSGNIKSLANMHSKFPAWLNVAIGYGADGMIAPKTNPDQIQGIPIPDFKRKHQFYLAPDIDLTRIPVRSKTLKLVLNAIGFIKFPMPALEITNTGIKFHPLYF
ncbi:MAG: DUF2279 domain-containing protein [Bacteroidales bacterium]|nr:DUF2279 domain-containing protein [Bacteroidales bacterium]